MLVGGALPVFEIDLQRLTSWYNHLVSCCSLWSFPMKQKANMAEGVWDMETCTPDISLKIVETLRMPVDFAGWKQWLEGDYLVMRVNFMLSSINDGPAGGLGAASHLLRVISPQSAILMVNAAIMDVYLNSFGKMVKQTQTTPSGVQVMVYNKATSPPESGLRTKTDLFQKHDPDQEYYII